MDDRQHLRYASGLMESLMIRHIPGAYVLFALRRTSALWPVLTTNFRQERLK